MGTQPAMPPVSCRNICPWHFCATDICKDHFLICASDEADINATFPRIRSLNRGGVGHWDLTQHCFNINPVPVLPTLLQSYFSLTLHSNEFTRPISSVENLFTRPISSVENCWVSRLQQMLRFSIFHPSYKKIALVNRPQLSLIWAQHYFHKTKVSLIIWNDTFKGNSSIQLHTSQKGNLLWSGNTERKEPYHLPESSAVCYIITCYPAGSTFSLYIV